MYVYPNQRLLFCGVAEPWWWLKFHPPSNSGNMKKTPTCFHLMCPSGGRVVVWWLMCFYCPKLCGGNRPFFWITQHASGKCIVEEITGKWVFPANQFNGNLRGWSEAKWSVISPLNPNFLDEIPLHPCWRLCDRGGTWNRRPSGVSTMWRLLNIVDTERPWTVTGLAFYADEVPSEFGFLRGV